MQAYRDIVITFRAPTGVRTTLKFKSLSSALRAVTKHRGEQLIVRRGITIQELNANG